VTEDATQSAATRLGLSALATVPEPARPGYDPRDLRIGLVHLGAGAFFRAHQAWYTDRVTSGGDHSWGVLASSQRSPEVANQLAAQDGLYSVLERPTHGPPSARVVGVIRQTACAAVDPQPIVEALASPDVHAATLTVTDPDTEETGSDTVTIRVVVSQTSRGSS
jgi:fructuronate reductase